MERQHLRRAAVQHLADDVGIEPWHGIEAGVVVEPHRALHAVEREEHLLRVGQPASVVVGQAHLVWAHRNLLASSVCLQCRVVLPVSICQGAFEVSRTSRCIRRAGTAELLRAQSSNSTGGSGRLLTYRCFQQRVAWRRHPPTTTLAAWPGKPAGYGRIAWRGCQWSGRAAGRNALSRAGVCGAADRRSDSTLADVARSR
jgi:hypothetical protein